MLHSLSSGARLGGYRHPISEDSFLNKRAINPFGIFSDALQKTNFCDLLKAYYVLLIILSLVSVTMQQVFSTLWKDHGLQRDPDKNANL